MKKIALFSLMVCCGMINNAFSGSCGPSVTLAYVGDQTPKHDEFLYISKSEYDKSVSGWENSSHYSSGDGHGYECDNAFCPNLHVIEMPAGHVFKGQVVDRKMKYQCLTALGGSPDGDDMWVPVNNGICETKWGDLEVEKSFPDVKTTTDCSGLAKSEENTGLVKNWKVYCLENLGPGLICKPNECVDEYAVVGDRCVKKRHDDDDKRIGANCQRWLGVKTPGVLACCYASIGENPIVRFDNDTGACSCIEPNTTWDGFSQCIPNGNVKECAEDSDCPTGKKCMLVDGDKSLIGGGIIWSDLKAGHCYDAEHIDCFNASGLKDPTFWSSNEAKCACGNKNGIKYDWNPEKRSCVQTGTVKSCKEKRSTAEGKACCDLSSKEAKWENNQCKCVEEGKEFKIVAGAGQCVAKQQNNGGSGNLSNCYYKYDVSITCANGNSYHEKGSERLNKSQLAGLSCSDFNARFGSDIKKWQELYGDLCARHNANVPAGPSASEVSSAVSKLESFTKYADSNKSVWKDAEGKFNTARLASDLTAGVVLGTVGGVVSGVVIKKKQVEKGFDALHCTVGGQKIADWGDTFSVGLQR